MECKGSLMTIMVADMDRAVGFYTETLGLALRFRAGNDWAEVNSPGVRAWASSRQSRRGFPGRSCQRRVARIGGGRYRRRGVRAHGQGNQL